MDSEGTLVEAGQWGQQTGQPGDLGQMRPLVQATVSPQEFRGLGKIIW